jgi:hypothetical protein
VGKAAAYVFSGWQQYVPRSSRGTHLDTPGAAAR